MCSTLRHISVGENKISLAQTSIFSSCIFPLDKTEVFSSWLPLSHNQSREFSRASWGALLPPFLCRDTSPWAWGPWHRSTCAASGTGFVLLKSHWQNEAGRCSCSGSDELSATPKPKMVLDPCWSWLCFDWPEQGSSCSSVFSGFLLPV